jgi:protein O-GlcNAc transferase
VSHTSRRAYFELYRDIDICLDTLPYNGHTTSIDALWMGVPALTLVGPTLVGRAGLCQSANLRLPELCALTAQQLVDRATELAGSPDRLLELRGALRERLTQSPLMDGARFAASFETAYRQMWRKWCKMLA